MRRALQTVVPIGCAATHQYRCGATDGKSSKGAATSLDIGLDFSKMDFAAVTRATTAAARSDEDVRQAALSGLMSDLDTLNRSITPGPAGSGTAKPASQMMGAKRPGGAVAPTAGNRRNASDAQRTGGSRGTLKETLQDFLVSGNWAKAVAYYNRALKESCDAVAAKEPAQASSTAAAVAAPDADGIALAPLPNAATPVVYDPRFAHVGVGRWQGIHLKLVLRCLFAAEAIPAMTQVWSSMVQTDAPKHRFDAFAANHVLSDTRGRSTDSVGQLTYQSTRRTMDKAEWHAFVTEWKAVKRRIALDLGRYAESEQWVLNESALRALHAAKSFEERRVAASATAPAASMNIQELNSALELAVQREGHKGRAPCDANAAGDAAGDATVEGLLQHAKDNGLRWNERTYVLLLKQLRLANAMPGPSTSDDPRAESSHQSETISKELGASTKELGDASTWEASPLLSKALELLDQYESELGGHRYPAAYVIAEVLDFVKHRKRHDRRVYEIVARLVRPEARDAFLARFAPSPGAGSTAPPPGTEGMATDSIRTRLQTGPLDTIPWGGAPNAKVFEVLIRHAMHMRRLDECWAWFREMDRLGVRGTGVTYHTMIDVAAGSGGGGGGLTMGSNPAAEQILGVYAKMKEVGRDVTSVGTTVNLINAWSNKNQASLRRRLR